MSADYFTADGPDSRRRGGRFPVRDVPIGHYVVGIDLGRPLTYLRVSHIEVTDRGRVVLYAVDAHRDYSAYDHVMTMSPHEMADAVEAGDDIRDAHEALKHLGDHQ